MDREEARAAATGAKADRERPRCPRCYSTALKPSSYVCLKCDTVSSDVNATRAGREIIDLGDGRFRHRDTGEIIVPGVAVEDVEAHYWIPVLAQGEAEMDATAGTAGDEHPEGLNNTRYRNPVTTEPSKRSDWNPVLAPLLFPPEPASVEDEGPAVSTNQAVPSPRAAYAATSPPCPDDVAREREEEHGDPDADFI